MKKLILLLPFLFLSLSITAQDDDDDAPAKMCSEDINKKAMDLYKKGTDKKKYKKPERLDFLKKAMELEPDFAEANLKMGLEIVVRCKLENAAFTPAVPYFLRAVRSCPQVHSEPYYYIGFDYYEQVKNDSAVKYLEKFIAFKDDDQSKYAKDYQAEIYNAKMMIKSAKKESALKKNVPFDPKVVKGVSTERDEYLAYVSPDDKKCFFVRRLPIKDPNKVYASDKEKEVFMIATRDKTGLFNAGQPMTYPFNETEDNQGGCSISIDNKHLYFAMMRQEGGAQPNCDIYVSDFADDSWSEIRKLSATVNDPKYWDSQPTIAADGVTLYFASDRPGGYGGIDLYVTKKDPKTGLWSVPKNLGPKVNTKGDEKTPFIHSDSETLYFSSTGHFGFGAYDIFFVRKDEKGEWIEPENIGSPINGATDDTGFFVSTDTKSGYFFSFDEGKVRGKGVGRYDLYSFDLYQEARPQQVAFITGEIKDKSGNDVPGAVVEIKNTKTKEKTYAVVDSTTGKFMAAINLKKKDDLLITIKKDSFAFASKVLSTKDLTSYEAAKSDIKKEIKLEIERAQPGKSFVINNIYYNTNSADLKEESRIVLESFAEYLKENPNIKVEIQGHTDNVGNAKDNDALSTNRAFTVKTVLEELKIDGKRINAKGFGAAKPIVPNTSEENRAKNRRTEFLVIEH
ncbi:MAG: outer membrane protein/peptidoglycan-associated protein [Bacteroidetes bacterium]|jgi:outer membrane protein OmpA-like peptidoglycan-associated protein|nr:outer membrane protein/peptidoglycan-associated protein [Bacteroidota bacterium]